MSKRRSTNLVFPPGTYQTPQFFWRGGDEFKEREHLQADYLQAKKEHTKAKRELEETKKEYEQVNELLSNRDKQACALASALGGGSQTTEENSKLNKQIAKLTLEISDIEDKISEASQRTQPVYISQLEKERATSYIAVEKLSHESDTLKREIDDMTQEFYALLTSQEWLDANNINAQHQIISREKAKMRQEVNRLFEEQNYAKENKKEQALRVRTDGNQHLMQLSDLSKKRDNLQNKLAKVQHERFMAQTYRRIMISSKLDIISQLNNALAELGLEQVNVEELKQKYLPDGPLPPVKKRPSTAMTNRNSRTQRSIRRPNTQHQTTRY